MNPQIKDHFYDQFLKEPTKDNFRDFMKKSCGELNEMDFKETWIDKGPLAKIMLAMANNGGGIIVFGVKENEDNTFDILGLDSLKDTADISNSISRRFGNVLYNNLKGRILSINKKTDEIVFQVLVDKVIDKTEAGFAGVKLVECAYDDKSIVEFNVKRRVERDSDADYSEEIVPFQIAYAVSIHKAQGLEYESVKVVITEDVDERISHNIFYTAITRTTDRLKIYMSKETQNKLAEKFVKSNVGLQQAQLFAGHAGLKLKNKLSS